MNHFTLIGDSLVKQIPYAVCYEGCKTSDLSVLYDNFEFQTPVVYCVGFNDLCENQITWNELFLLYNELPRSRHGTSILIPPLQTNEFYYQVATTQLLDDDLDLFFWPKYQTCDDAVHPTKKCAMSMFCILVEKHFNSAKEL